MDANGVMSAVYDPLLRAIRVDGDGGGGGGTVDTIVEGTNIDVDATDPANPIVGVTPGAFATPAAVTAVDDALDAHILDTTDAHDASAISFSATGGIAATDVQAAIAEVDAEKQAQVTSAILRHTGSNLTLAANDATWNNFPTIGTISIPAVAGDLIEAFASWLWGAENITVHVDICTEVSSAVVNSLISNTAAQGDASTTDGGASALAGRAAVGAPAAATTVYAVQAGDISAGNVTLRLRYHNTVSSATQRTITSVTTYLLFGVKNYGQ